MNVTVKEGQGYRLNAVFNSVIRSKLPSGGSGISKIRSISRVSLSSSVTLVQLISFYIQVIKNLASWVYYSRALHCTDHYPSASHVHAQAHSRTALLPPWRVSFGITSPPSLALLVFLALTVLLTGTFFVLPSFPSCMKCFPSPDCCCRTTNSSSCKAHSIMPRYGCKVKEVVAERWNLISAF